MAGIIGDFVGELGRRTIGLGGDTAFLSDPAHAKTTYNIQGGKLDYNMPRFNFQFLVVFEMAGGELPENHYKKYFPDEAEFKNVNGLVKSVDMPSMNIETEVLNQYNKKRVSQKKIEYEPIRLVMHDVVDGKTLRFWEMYYEYYFKDGVNNIQRDGTPPPAVSSPELKPSWNMKPEDFRFLGDENVSQFDKDTFLRQKREERARIEAENKRKQDIYKAQLDQNHKTNVKRDIYTNAKVYPKSGNLRKSEFRNDIVTDSFTGSWGYNLERVNAERYLFRKMDIYQFHGGRFNRVTLINPRISKFSHTKLAQSDSGLSEISFTIEYESVVYLNKNKEIGSEIADNYLADSHFVDKEFNSGGGIIGEFIDRFGGEDSVLGSTLDSGLGLLGDQLPSQYLKAASSSVFGGGHVPYPDASSAFKNIGTNALKNQKGALGTTFTNTAIKANSNYNPFRKG